MVRRGGEANVQSIQKRTRRTQDERTYGKPLGGHSQSPKGARGADSKSVINTSSKVSMFSAFSANRMSSRSRASEPSLLRGLTSAPHGTSFLRHTVPVRHIGSQITRRSACESAGEPAGVVSTCVSKPSCSLPASVGTASPATNVLTSTEGTEVASSPASAPWAG